MPEPLFSSPIRPVTNPFGSTNLTSLKTSRSSSQFVRHTPVESTHAIHSLLSHLSLRRFTCVRYLTAVLYTLTGHTRTGGTTRAVDSKAVGGEPKGGAWAYSSEKP